MDLANQAEDDQATGERTPSARRDRRRLASWTRARRRRWSRRWRLVSLHEIGGDADEDLLQAADSLSFLEVNVDLSLALVHGGRCDLERAAGAARLDVRAHPGRAGARARPAALRGGDAAVAADWLGPDLARRGARAPGRARGRGDRRRRRDVPGDPPQPAALAPSCCSPAARPGLDRIGPTGAPARRDGHAPGGRALRGGASGWPALAHAFSVVASPRVRNQATVGGVLADADYASDPPAMLCALGARVVVRAPRGAA